MATLSPPYIPQNTFGIGRALIAAASLIALLYYGRDFFVTLIISAIFAFILDPAVMLVMKLRLPRAAATGIVIGVAIVVVYILGAMAWSQIATLKEELPTYGSRVTEVVDAVNTRIDDVEKKTLDTVLPKRLLQQQQSIEQKPLEAQRARRKKTGSSPLTSPPAIQEVRIHTDPRPALGTIYGFVSGYVHVLVMASFVPFLVYFMLSWRDHINRRFLMLFPGENRYLVGKSWSYIGESTRAFVLGNFLLWVFLSSVSAVSFFFCRCRTGRLLG